LLGDLCTVGQDAQTLPADGDDESCLVMQDTEGNEFRLD
jgi:hypothetical protein